jgi:hypothetical protein
MNHTPAFVISEFTNPSREIVFRVAGWLDGKRVRKNFATRTDAEAERQILEIQRLQTETGIRVSATRLEDAQLKEAEAMFARLAGQPRSLSFYVDFALANYREPEKQKPLVNAVAEYITAKEHEFSQDQISVPQMSRIRWDLKRLCRYFAGKTVAELTVSALVAFLEVGRPGMKTSCLLARCLCCVLRSDSCQSRSVRTEGSLSFGKIPLRRRPMMSVSWL